MFSCDFDVNVFHTVARSGYRYEHVRHSATYRSIAAPGIPSSPLSMSMNRTHNVRYASRGISILNSC
jgi:hypothetical protein